MALAVAVAVAGVYNNGPSKNQFSPYKFFSLSNSSSFSHLSLILGETVTVPHIIPACMQIPRKEETPKTEVMNHVPEGVIEEILSWLPVKSLMRFRCVSKLLLSLISNPQFAKLHFERSSTHTQRILYAAASEVQSMDFNASLHDDSAIFKLNFPFCTPPAHLRIVGSCRGILLLVLDNYEKLFLWNPSTVDYKRIPRSPLWDPFLYGFGYDETKDDYLVVQVSYDPNVSVLDTNIEIFSLKSNSWTKLEVPKCPFINLMVLPKSGSLLNGAIHWLALNHDVPVSHGVILALDLAGKKLREVPMPDNFNDEYSDLGVFQGCLNLIDLNYSDVIEMWVMREYGVKSSWIKSLIVSLNKIPGNYFSPICYTKSGDVIGMASPLALVKCNHRGELLEYREYCHHHQGFVADANVYTESLFSLSNGHGEEGEDMQLD